MRLSRLWVFVSLIIACTALPKPELAREDCLARSDCYIVIVDNSDGQFAAAIRINGRHYGYVASYNHVEFTLFKDQLRDGNCAIVNARFITAPYNPPLTSTEECIYPGQYYQVDITNGQRAIWLTPYRINEKLMK